jgi:hypothetical protein
MNSVKLYEMNDYIGELIYDGTLTYIYGEQLQKFQCLCGSTVRRSNIRSHVTSVRHVNAVQRECSICYDQKLSFLKCRECRNEVCRDCLKQVQSCPYCRGKRKFISKNDNYLTI